MSKKKKSNQIPLKETTQEERNKETARLQWDSWITNLKEKEQPKSCDIDDDDCEACGS